MAAKLIHLVAAALACAVAALASPALAGQPLETETARLPAQGHGEIQLVYEHQWASQGGEDALPVAGQYGITDRLEIAVEPVVYTSIRPKTARSARGFGDTEVTMTYLVSRESGAWPAFAVAGEVKLPTTRNPVIGTGGTDYRLIAIASKRIGDVDWHANLGYTLVGKARGGASLDNIFDFAIAAEYPVNPRWTLVAEVLGNTSAGGSEAAVGASQEASSSVVSGLVGGVYHMGERTDLSAGFVYDSDRAAMLRSGLTFRF